jgi:hypothetical protein
MPPWVYLWILRLAGGERLEKAKTEDYRYWFGYLVLTPIWIFAFPTLDRGILDQGTTFAIWVYSVCFALVVIASSLIWAKLVPAKISLLLSLPVWVLTICIILDLI